MSINTISPQSGVLTFIKAASRSAQLWSTALSNTRADQDNPLLTLLAKSDPDKAAALRQEQRQAQQEQRQAQELLQRLKSSKKDINEQRKAAAREKVERLKAQIQVLLMMSSGDPEAVARQAAHLARELSAAAKQYASAGGSAGLVGDVTSNLLTTGAATATPTPTAEPVLGGGGTNTISVTGTNGRDADAQTLSSRDEQKAAFLKIGSDLKSKAAEQNAAREEDQKFIQTVRNLVSALHAIIKKAEQEIRREDGTSSDRDVTHVDITLRDTQQALQNISAVAFSAPDSINTAVSLTV